MHTKAVKYFSAISLNENIKFLKLLIRWQGSVWKLLWIDFIGFSVCYIAIAVFYRLYLINDPIQKRMFDSIVVYFNRVGSIVPLSFLLGFFVSTVLGRWWKIVNSIPWMNKPAFTCQALITGDNAIITKDIRHTIVRYMNLAWVLSIMFISHKVKKRFRVDIINKKSNINHQNDNNYSKPKLITIRERMDKINYDKVVNEYFGKLIMEEEIKVFENFEKIDSKPTFITPLMWATRLIEKCRDVGYIKSDNICMNLFTMIDEFKTNLENLEVYNEFNVPLVYTQVIVIVVYTFLISELLSDQIISNNIYESYFPIFGIFKFIIYMGWFKMGLSFINPFGSDPSDLPLDEILNYNLEISSTIAAAEDYFYPNYLNSNLSENNFENLSKFRLLEKSVKLNEKPKCSKKKYIDGHLFATHDEPEE